MPSWGAGGPGEAAEAGELGTSGASGAAGVDPIWLDRRELDCLVLSGRSVTAGPLGALRRLLQAWRRLATRAQFGPIPGGQESDDRLDRSAFSPRLLR